MTGSRLEKVADLVREEVARLLQTELHDRRLGFITITQVVMSSDLRHARIYVSVLAQQEARAQAMSALQTARGFIRRRLGETLKLRYTPEITFSLDTTGEYADRIESLLEQTRKPPSGEGQT